MAEPSLTKISYQTLQQGKGLIGLAHKEIRKIEHKASIKVRYKPILLGGLHNLHGITPKTFSI